MSEKLEQIARHVSLLSRHGIVAKRRAVPRPRFPILVETEYGSGLAALIRRGASVLDELKDAMPSLLARNEANFLRHDAGPSDIARRLIEEAREKMAKQVTRDDVSALARLAGVRTSKAQKADLQRQIRAGIGIEVPIDDTNAREMLNNFANQNAQLISSVPTEMLDDVANLTMRAFTKRMTPDTYASELLKIVDVTEGKARQIARNEIGTLNGQLAEERHRELGIVAYFWRTRQDRYVRPVHRGREGMRFPWDHPPKGGHAGIDYGCVTGESLVSLHAPARKAYRRWYSGELTEIVSGDGRTIRCTPNHPVLTARGWLPAHLVEVTDYLVNVPAKRFEIAIGDPERRDATAEQVFGALASVGVAHRVVGAASWFHGDSVGEDVDVVEVDWSLLDDGASEGAEMIGEDELTRAAPPALASGHSTAGLVALDVADRGAVGSGGGAVTLRLGHVRPPDEHGGAAPPNLDASSDQRTPNRSARDEAEPLRDRLFANAGLVHANDLANGEIDASRPDGAMPTDDLAHPIVAGSEVLRDGVHPAELLVEGHRFALVKARRVMRSTYAGFVYNFETDTGWFGAHGLIVHNCRCDAQPDLTPLIAMLKAHAKPVR